MESTSKEIIDRLGEVNGKKINIKNIFVPPIRKYEGSEIIIGVDKKLNTNGLIAEGKILSKKYYDNESMGWFFALELYKAQKEGTKNFTIYYPVRSKPEIITDTPSTINIQVNRYMIDFLKNGPTLNDDERNQIEILKYILEKETFTGLGFRKAKKDIGEITETGIESTFNKRGRVIINTKSKGTAQLRPDKCIDIMHSNPKKFREIIERLIEYGEKIGRINSNEIKALKILSNMSDSEMKSQRILAVNIPGSKFGQTKRVVKSLINSESVYTDYNEKTHAYVILHKVMENDIIATTLALNVISNIKEDIVSRYGITNLDSDRNLNFLAMVQYHEDRRRADNFRTQFMLVRLAKEQGIDVSGFLIDGKLGKKSEELYNKICQEYTLVIENNNRTRNIQIENLYNDVFKQKMDLPKVEIAGIKYAYYYAGYYNKIQEDIENIRYMIARK